jgi:hypothetical protein
LFRQENQDPTFDADRAYAGGSGLVDLRCLVE